MGKKIKTSVGIDEDLLKWLDKRIEKKKYANVSHAVNYALQRLKDEEKEGEASSSRK